MIVDIVGKYTGRLKAVGFSDVLAFHELSFLTFPDFYLFTFQDFVKSSCGSLFQTMLIIPLIRIKNQYINICILIRIIAVGMYVRRLNLYGMRKSSFPHIFYIIKTNGHNLKRVPSHIVYPREYT